MLAGRRFVITGLTHLSARVADALVAQRAEVTVIADPEAGEDAREAADHLGESCRIVKPGYDREGALVDADLAGSSGLLLLADDDLESLRVAAAAHAIAPDVPVVLRTFQPELVDEVSRELNIRRAFSVAALAAPSFVAAALGEEVLQTLRLGDEEVPLCVLDVHADSPLGGRHAAEVKASHECAIVAVARPGEPWMSAPSLDVTLDVGDRVLVGGRQLDVLGLARRNDESEWDSAGRRRARRRARSGPGATLRHLARPTLLRVSAVIFTLVVLANFAVTRWVGGQATFDAALTAAGTSVGNLPPPTDNRWVKAFNLGAIGAGVVLPWILLSYITAVVLAERLELRMVRRARRMHDHIVLVGLGHVGFRVAQILADLRIPTVVIEQEPDSSFVDAIAAEFPVIRGNGQLLENLERCGVARARCIIACTHDDLANLAACREARRVQPEIRTVLRAFDDTVSGRLATAFRIDVTLSSTSVASTAFVGAAVDEFAMRPIELEGLSLPAYRFTPDAELPTAVLHGWRSRGLRVLALEHAGVIEVPSLAVTHQISAGDAAVVVGPADLVREFAKMFE